MTAKSRIRVLLVALAGVSLLWFLRPAPVIEEATPSVAARPHDLFQQVRAYSWSNAPRYQGTNTWRPASQLDSNALQVVEALRKLRTGTNAAQAVVAASRVLPRPTQEQAIADLHRRYGERFEVYLRPEKTTPMQIKGFTFPPAPMPAGATADEARLQTAKAVLNEFRDALLIQDPDVELQLNHRERDNLGRSNLRFSQYYQGLEVWPCELSVHFDPQDNADLLDGVFVATPEGIQTQPKLTASEALAKARASVPGGTQGQATEPVLLIYAPVDGETRLGWKLDLTVGLLHDWQIVIDAENGSTLSSVNKCMCANVQGSGMDMLGVLRNLNVAQSNTVYHMVDTSKPMFNPTTGTGEIRIRDANLRTENQVVVNNRIQNIDPVTSSNPHSWANAHAVSAAFNFSEVYDYYLERHGRNSIDGKGGSISAIVRIGGLDNAWWNSDLLLMGFGNEGNHAASLDVVAHEMTHGVVSSVGSSGGLKYQNQSGALNEAISDIFGEMVESHSNGTTDWLNGSQLSGEKRNLRDPSAMTLLGRPYPARSGFKIHFRGSAG